MHSMIFSFSFHHHMVQWIFKLFIHFSIWFYIEKIFFRFSSHRNQSKQKSVEEKKWFCCCCWQLFADKAYGSYRFIHSFWKSYVSISHSFFLNSFVLFVFLVLEKKWKWKEISKICKFCFSENHRFSREFLFIFSFSSVSVACLSIKIIAREKRKSNSIKIVLFLFIHIYDNFMSFILPIFIA